MPRPFNTQLRGFLGVLAAKVQGQAPNEFEEAVRATLAVEPFLFSQLEETWRATTAVSGVGAVGFQPLVNPWDAEVPVPWLCPQDQIWRVSYVSTSLIAAGATLQQCAVGIRFNRFVASAVVSAISDAAYPQSVGQYMSVYRKEPLIMLPGDEVGGLILQNNVASTIQQTMHMRVARISI